MPLVFVYWFFVGPALLLAALSLRGERKRAAYVARRLAELPEDPQDVPPNRDGLLSAEDIASLQGFGAYLKGTFGQNLAARAKTDATHVRGNDKQFGPAHLLDGRPDTYWATDDHVTSADVTFDLGRPVKFQVIRLKEAIRLGQRIDGFTLERWQSDSWEPIASSTSIGPRRLIRLDSPIIATRLRLRITQASASPALREFAVFSEAAPG